MTKIFENVKEGISKEELKSILNDMFYKVRSLSYDSKFSSEQQDMLCDAMDGAPGGNKGIQLLMRALSSGLYNRTENGYEKYFYTTEETIVKLNALINYLNEIVSRISTTNRGLKDGSRMAVIRHTDMPAVIVEGLFISNISDAKMLKDNNVLDNIAQGI